MQDELRRTSIFLFDEDKKAIEEIRRRFGCDSGSAAIRLALRVLAYPNETIQPLAELRPAPDTLRPTAPESVS